MVAELLGLPRPDPGRCIVSTCCACSSVGQSVGLLIRGSQVRLLPGAPTTTTTSEAALPRGQPHALKLALNRMRGGQCRAGRPPYASARAPEAPSPRSGAKWSHLRVPNTRPLLFEPRRAKTASARLFRGTSRRLLFFVTSSRTTPRARSVLSQVKSSTTCVARTFLILDSRAHLVAASSSSLYRSETSTRLGGVGSFARCKRTTPRR
jgi:hypothetical protein